MRSLAMDGRLWLTAAMAALVSGPLAALFAVEGIRLPLAAGAALAIAAGAAVLVGRRLPPALGAPRRARPLILALWIVLVAVATFQTLKLSGFMYAPYRTEWSPLPDNAFFATHSCLSAGIAAVAHARAGDNIYEPGQYDRATFPPLRVDAYMYPPTFLFLPDGLMAVAHDFYTARALWFAVQTITFAVVALAVAVWIGGRAGAFIAWSTPAIWLAAPFLLSLQIGNFHLTMFAGAMAAMLLLAAGWLWTGALLLAFVAAGKLIPLVLGAYLVGARRWRAVAACTVCGLAVTLASVALLGQRPLRDFLSYQVPRIQSGAAVLRWLADPNTVPSNESIVGFVQKLEALGVPGVTAATTHAAATVYGLAVLLLGVVAGAAVRRISSDGVSRLHRAALWLALLNLASFRSPFLPDAYAYIGTLWLAVLLAARVAPVGWRHVPWLALGWLLLTRVFGGHSFEPAVPFALVALTLGTQLLAFGLNAWAVVLALQPATETTTETSPALAWKTL